MYEYVYALILPVKQPGIKMLEKLKFSENYKLFYRFIKTIHNKNYI